ncbi:MAG: hypothetical protein KDD36_01490 [Flavobacteriales bacterium]|nr:hypothetical protein [Flavobacteriales bacterium]
MKKKTNVYILLVAAAVVWGLVIYRLVDGWGGQETYAVVPAVMKEVPCDLENNSFALLELPSDPFLERSVIRNNVRTYRPVSSQSSAPVKPKAKPEPKPPLRWPDVKFSGVVKGAGKEVAILSVDNKNFLLAEGEEAVQVKVVKLYSDSVQLKYEGEKKTILRK